MNKYQVKFTYGNNIVFESCNINDCIKFIEDKESKEWDEYCDYSQWCADNYEPRADFYSSYYIEYNGKIYDIKNIATLKDLNRYQEALDCLVSICEDDNSNHKLIISFIEKNKNVLQELIDKCYR